MLLDSDRCYRALKTHDARFDGRLFVGVSSTRIYCRPVCASGRLPRRENCSFYPSAAAAEAAGYRPCLHCRPELAPGNASVDASARLAQAAANLIEAVANAVAAGSLRLEPGSDVANTIEQLKTVPNVGEWTAQYIAMRVLTWPDAFPHTDCGVMKALGETNPRRVLERAEAWRPWRAYAVMHLWRSLKRDTL